MAAPPQAASFESQHVHAVYDEIASDFSRTRHSRWPFVERFLHKLPSGGIVLDAGTGNGKYLGCRSVLPWDGKAAESLPRNTAKGKGRATDATDDIPEAQRARSDLLPVGFDMSSGLLGIARGKGHEVVRGDCVDMGCWRRGAFNHAISIATIHHFATPARRIESVKQMILAVLPTAPPPSSPSPTSSSSALPSPEAKLLIVVWSLEQDPSLASCGGDRSARRTTGGKKGAVPVSAPETEVDGDGQDVFVPWEKQEQVPRREKGVPRRGRRAVGSRADGQGVVAAEEDRTPPPVVDQPTVSDPPTSAPKPTFNRYYHLFRQFELSSLVASAAAQLALEFDAPAGYPLDVVAGGENGRRAVEEADGWEAFVRLEEERWERENWVVEAAVGWRRVEHGQQQGA